MTGIRLTRRGRLLLHTFPVFLVMAAGVQSLAHRAGAGSRDAPRATSTPTVTASPTGSPTSTPTSTTMAAPPSPTRTPSPTATRAPTGYGTFAVAQGRSAVHGSGPLQRFTVEVERSLPETPRAVAAAVERILFDPRGWAGSESFQRVESGPVAFRVVLAGPSTTDRLCHPLDTGGIFSCFQHGRSVLNALRWRNGAASYRGDLASYRIYMVNHEVGHALGHRHRTTCGPGGLAYVMIQQTKGLLGCRANPWPLADER